MVGGRRADVLDLAAGAGALAAGLRSAGHSVVAADLSLAMLRQLGAAGSTGRVLQSIAEELPFAAASFDVVTVGTAFHWFEPGRALPEISRVLQPAGRLGLVWNSRDETMPWVQRLGDLLRGVQPPDLGEDWGTGSVTALAESSLFREMEYAEFSSAQALDLTGLIGLVSSRSYVIELDAQRRRRLCADVTRLYDETAGHDEAADVPKHVWLPYRTQCWRATARHWRSRDLVGPPRATGA